MSSAGYRANLAADRESSQESHRGRVRGSGVSSEGVMDDLASLLSRTVSRRLRA
jgi:hypothetical protein